MALRVPLRRAPGQPPGLGHDPRPPSCRGPGPIRAGGLRARAARRGRRGGFTPLRRGLRRGHRPHGTRAGTPVCGDPDRTSGPVRATGVLRRLHLPRGVPSAVHTARYRQDEDAGRLDTTSRLPGGGLVKRSLNQDHQHTLSGAYALDALPPEESVRFEDHLAECDACVQEVRGFSETTARLASAAASPPPEELRSAVMAEISRTRQLAPPPARMPEPPRRWGWGTILALAACLVLILSLGAVVLDQARQVQELRENER